MPKARCTALSADGGFVIARKGGANRSNTNVENVDLGKLPRQGVPGTLGHRLGDPEGRVEFFSTRFLALTFSTVSGFDCVK